MSFGQQIAGWLSMIVGFTLVGVHVVTVLRNRPSDQDRGLTSIAEKLADKAPLLGGGLIFVVIGMVVLGYLDLELNAGAS